MGYANVFLLVRETEDGIEPVGCFGFPDEASKWVNEVYLPVFGGEKYEARYGWRSEWCSDDENLGLIDVRFGGVAPWMDERIKERQEDNRTAEDEEAERERAELARLKAKYEGTT